MRVSHEVEYALLNQDRHCSTHPKAGYAQYYLIRIHGAMATGLLPFLLTEIPFGNYAVCMLLKNGPICKII